MAAPPVPTPADYFALTRILVVPSVWEEPFGRVAAEAMINAIPPLVGDRGSLPHVVGGDFSEGGGGRVLPIPDWMTFKTTKLPSEQEVVYRSVATRGRQIAEERYSENVSRRRHVDYFTSLKPGGRPFAECATSDPVTPTS
jgi:glycosyltransferase involved in cell wall biosynthesis